MDLTSDQESGSSAYACKVLKAIHAVNVYCKAHNYDTQLIHEWQVYAILNGVKSSAGVSYPVFSVWFLKLQLQLDVITQFTKHFN